MFIWVQLEYTLDGHCLGRTTFPIGREPPSSICFASLFPLCLWEKMIRKKNFPHRQGWNMELTHIVVGSLLLTCCLLAACFLLACWLLACCLLAGCLLAGCLLAGCLLLLVCWLLAGSLLAACWQVFSIDRELPTTMRVASLFPVPSLPMGKIFLPNQKNIPSAGREPGSKTHWGRGLPSYGKRCSS